MGARATVRTNRKDKSERMSYKIPKDPMILYSYINMMLRDRGESLSDLCAEIDADMDEIVDALAAAGFAYDETVNQFR